MHPTARAQATLYTTALFAGIYFPPDLTLITLDMTTPEKPTITLHRFRNNLHIVPSSAAQDIATVNIKRRDITNSTRRSGGPQPRVGVAKVRR